MDNWIEENCSEIDEAVFADNMLRYPENREKFKLYVDSWVQAIKQAGGGKTDVQK